MSNMSYCRFTNTLSDLRDCLDHLCDDGLSKAEHVARRRLVELCTEIAGDYTNDGELEPFLRESK